jgi:hypothetical protein
MDCRGIDFDLRPVRTGIWNYRFQIGRAVKSGRIKAVDQSLAILRFQTKINPEIRRAQGDELKNQPILLGLVEYQIEN